MTKNDIQNFVIRTVRTSRGALDLARRITGKNVYYNERQIENIILNYIEANNYDDDFICEVIDIHPDKPFFDVYFDYLSEAQQEKIELENARKKENKDGKKINAEGEKKEKATDAKKYTFPKIAMISAGVVIGGVLIYSLVKKNK